MNDVYTVCPKFENERIIIRLLCNGDVNDLLTDFITETLGLILPAAYELFHCDMIATKAVEGAGERLFTRLLELGWFEPDNSKTTVYKVTPLGETKLSELGLDICKKD